MSAKYFWAVVGRSNTSPLGQGFPVASQERWSPLMIYSTKETAIKARTDRYVFKDQMERETMIKRVRIG